MISAIQGTSKKPSSSLDRPGGKSADEVAREHEIKCQEGEARQGHAGEKKAPIDLVLAEKESHPERDRLEVVAAEQDQREKEVVPNRHEVVNGYGGQSGAHQRQHHAPVDLKLRAPVDAGGVL